MQCHHGDLADLGFATSGSIDLVIAAHTLREVDDLPRLFRQVHRVLRPGSAFIMADTHPVRAMFDGSGPQSPVVRGYGDTPSPTISERFQMLERTNFQIDAMHELWASNAPQAMTPAVLVIRARKLGV